MRSRRLLALAALLVALPASAQSGLSEAERVYGLSTFWKEVDYNFAFFDQVPGLDWDSVYVALLPEAAAAPDTFAYFRVLQKMVAHLDDGHTNVYLPRDFDVSRYVAAPAVQLQAIGRRAVVANVAASLAASLPVGSEIVAVDGLSVEEKVRRDVFPYFSTSAEHVRWTGAILGNPMYHGIGLLVGAPGTEAALTVRTPDGTLREVAVPRVAPGADVAWSRPPEPAVDRLEWRWLPGDVAYVQVNTMADPAVVSDFEAILPELRRARGLILDLRRNGGGDTGNAAGIARYLLAEPALGSAWRTREHRAAQKAWGAGAPGFFEGAPEYRAYADGTAWYVGEPDTLAPAEAGRLLVPTAVLTGWRTASAAEDFLIYLDGQPHITKVGGPTYGSTGQPLMFMLPGGIAARVCTKRDTYPDGRDFVGPGVIPDVHVEETVEDVASGRDAVLERAQAVLADRLDGR